MGVLRPEEVRHPDLPLAMRGYDRERVDRLLARVADAYALVWEQSQALRERLRSLEVEFAAAQGEAEASARAVAELLQRPPAANGELVERGEAFAALESRLDRAEGEREQALADLRRTSQRASELSECLSRLENAQSTLSQTQLPTEETLSSVADAEAARLLVAAARAADDVRDAARARALRTLKKARELSALVHAQVEREREELAEMQERRRQVEHEAEEILAQARAEAAHIVAATDAERQRVRELLTSALASLEAEAATSTGNLVGDLSARLDLSSDHLYEATETTAT
jgi:DivIVA domain-containing protein